MVMKTVVRKTKNALKQGLLVTIVLLGLLVIGYFAVSYIYNTYHDAEQSSSTERKTINCMPPLNEKAQAACERAEREGDWEIYY